MPLRTECQRGHDLTVEGSRRRNGQCKACWSAGYARYAKTPKGREARRRAQAAYRRRLTEARQ